MFAVRQGEVDPAEAADKLSAQIAGAPDKLKGFVDKLADQGSKAADKVSKTSTQDQ